LGIRKEKGDILLVNHPIIRRIIKRNIGYLKDENKYLKLLTDRIHLWLVTGNT